jgi:hypothetical protein
MNLENDFLDSNNVTGEVMNLDDFLKELQVNEMVEHAEGGRRGGPPLGHDPDHRAFQQLIRPANIEALKEQHPGHQIRASVMQHVGKAPDLHMMQTPAGTVHLGDHMADGVSLPHRDVHKEQGQAIPQASVRPLVRSLPPEGKHDSMEHMRQQDSKSASSSKPAVRNIHPVCDSLCV